MSMALPIQLISTDFDGTLFAEFERPPVPVGLQQLLAALQAQGARWVINTGRDMSNLMESLVRARLSVWPDYLVLVEREIHVREGAHYVPLTEWNRRCTLAHAELFGRVRPDIARLAAWINQRFEATVYEDAFSPFCLIAGDNGDADQIVAYLEEYCRTIPELTVVRNDVYARFSHVGFSKGTALSELARRLEVPAERVLAAGDHWNDLPMLQRERAGYLVAPANAIPAVKELVRRQGGFVSDEICGSGVLAGIEHHLQAGSARRS
ncbi:MAG: HAD-IIB family hydrolase [Verrucomicrobia bacterium]|nr:HAD-IIB family hydrolase [Verrucomicrobiota bacterium]